MRVVVVTFGLLLALAAPAGADLTGPDIVGFLNAQREAHGIPAGIVEDPALSDGCAKHNAWGARNDKLQHEEELGSPGYTPEGDQAARTSVLYRGGDPWSPVNNPFETAPIHLAQLLAPRLDRMGASENGGYGCASTLASRARPAPPADVTYTYPGDATTGWAVAQTASESPYTPGERVGIPAGARTGPYLYAFFDGPDLDPGSEASNASATLTGPAGPVPVKVADNMTDGLRFFLPTGAQIIPEAPLAPFTSYRAAVTATVAGRVFAREWTFTTGGTGQPFMVTAKRRKRRVALTFTSSLPLRVTVAVRGRTLRRRSLSGSGTVRVRLPRRVRKRAKVTLTVVANGRTYTLRR